MLGLKQRSSYEELNTHLQKHKKPNKELSTKELHNIVKIQQARDRYLKTHLRQLEHVKKEIEARETKTKNIMTRREWLNRQTSANYKNELDRITNELKNTKISPISEFGKNLTDRQKILQKLFSDGNYIDAGSIQV